MNSTNLYKFRHSQLILTLPVVGCGHRNDGQNNLHFDSLLKFGFKISLFQLHLNVLIVDTNLNQ